MGSLSEVRDRLTETAPDINWSDPKWGVLDREGFSIEFSIGNEDPCTGFALHIVGGADACSVVEALIENNGWYAFDTTEGEWLHHVEDFAEE